MLGPFNSPTAFQKHLSPDVTGSPFAVASSSILLKLSVQNWVFHMAPRSLHPNCSMPAYPYKAELSVHFIKLVNIYLEYQCGVG